MGDEGERGETEQGETGQDETEQGETGQDETEQGETGQDETGQDEKVGRGRKIGRGRKAVERNACGARIKANGLSAAKRDIFLATLAETFSTQTAAAAAGADMSAFRQLRERDEAFAANWARAHAYGLESMEGLLAAAAMGQPVPEGFDPDAVLAVIQRRRGSVGTPEHTGRVSRVKQVSIAEVDRELLRRLAAMKTQRTKAVARGRK